MRCLKLCDKLWNKEDYVRGLCVGVSNFSTNNVEQLSLFNFNNAKVNTIKKDEKLQKVMDEIRDKYGSDKIMYADMLKKKS